MVDLSSEMADLWASLGSPAAGRSRVIQITAARTGEGASTVARELAHYAARKAGRSVWLVDLDLVTAFSAVLASVNCAGPGLGSVGPASNYAVLSNFQIWVCTLGMLLGRLEILSFMALLTPAFWRR